MRSSASGVSGPGKMPRNKIEKSPGGMPDFGTGFDNVLNIRAKARQKRLFGPPQKKCTNNEEILYTLPAIP